MKWWVAQNDNGLIHLFAVEPKRYKAYNGLHYWAVKNNNSIVINDDFQSFIYIDDKGVNQCRYLADIIGFKRKDIDHGIVIYKGVSMKEAKQIEINIDLKML